MDEYMILIKELSNEAHYKVDSQGCEEYEGIAKFGKEDLSHKRFFIIKEDIGSIGEEVIQIHNYFRKNNFAIESDENSEGIMGFNIISDDVVYNMEVISAMQDDKPGYILEFQQIN